MRLRAARNRPPSQAAGGCLLLGNVNLGREPRRVERGSVHALHDKGARRRRPRARTWTAGRGAEETKLTCHAGADARTGTGARTIRTTLPTIAARTTLKWSIRARLGARVRAIQTVPVARTTAFGSRTVGARTF